MDQSNRTSLDLIAILVHQALPSGICVDLVSVKYTKAGNWTCRLAEIRDGKQYYRLAEGSGEYLHYVTPPMLAGNPRHSGKQDKGPGYRPATRDLLDWLFEERDA